jgi:hypothetical protein
MKEIYNFCLLGVFLFSATSSFAAPSKRSAEISDRDVEVVFEVHAPWNILEGKATMLRGNVTVTTGDTPDKLRAEVSAQEIEYKAGLSIAGRLVAAWLRANSPTPAKFVIGKSSVTCARDPSVTYPVCKGTVVGMLTIWGKDYSIDFPVETQSEGARFIVTGGKHIKWGEYGFGDANSTIASLNPVIAVTFSIDLSKLTSRP